MTSSLRLVFCLLLVVSLDNTNGLPYNLAPTGLQVIPHRDGFIPVFIRIGDTPLEQINPQLAEAFQYHDQIANQTTTIKPTRQIATTNQASLYKLFVNGYKLKMNATNYRFVNDLNDHHKGSSHVQKIYKIPIVSQKVDENA